MVAGAGRPTGPMGAPGTGTTVVAWHWHWHWRWRWLAAPSDGQAA
jgi:hypothetical protein